MTDLCVDSAQSRVSDSDYGTSIYTSDEESLRSSGSDGSTRYSFISRGDSLNGSRNLRPGMCPHCFMTFRKPVVLSCGHSLCSTCCNRLLNSLNGNGIGRFSKKTRIRMGVKSLYKKTSASGLSSDPSTSSTSSIISTDSIHSLTYRTPECPQCGEPPKLMAPIPNIELERLLFKYLPRRITEYENPVYKDSNFEETLFNASPSSSIHERLIAVVGGPGVGKTSITRVQYGNEMLICGENAEKSGLLIDIVDDHKIDEENLDKAHGFILVYSITDRDSLTTADLIASMIRRQRGDTVPIVLIASKSDADRRRAVPAYEGQLLARRIGAPFREVSARRNDGINEAFDELLSLMEGIHQKFSTKIIL